MNARCSLAVGLAALLGAAGCGSKDDPVATPVLTITPSTQTLAAGDTGTAFTVTASSGTPTVTWTLTGVGTLSTTTGPATTYSPPATVESQVTATLTASAPGYTSGTATITITPAVAHTIAITPSSRTVVAGGPAVEFTAVGSPATAGVTWTLTGVGTLSTTSGAFTSYTPPATLEFQATATLTASAPGYTSGTATITVESSSATVLTVVPSFQSVTAGGTPARFVAMASSGTPPITWTLTGVGTLSNTTGPATTYTPPTSVPDPATETLTASAPGYTSAMATIPIHAGFIGSVIVTPSTLTVVAGGPAVAFTATDSLRGQPIDWTSWYLAGVGAISTSEGPFTTYTPPATVATRTTVALSARAAYLDSATAVITVEPPAPATMNGLAPAPEPPSERD